MTHLPGCTRKTRFSLAVIRAGVFASWILLIAVGAFVFGGCGEEEEPELEFLIATESVEYEGVEVPSERVAQLRRDIREYQDAVEDVVSNMSRVASFQKMLANELMQQRMYEPALRALQRAMELETANPTLYYLAGLASAESARAHIINDRHLEYFEQAETLYREAIKLKPQYREALFGLAVLLAFELGRPEDALEYARRVAEIDTRDPTIRFLLANILVRTERFGEAIEIYDALSREAPSAAQRRRAEENRDELRRELQ